MHCTLLRNGCVDGVAQRCIGVESAVGNGFIDACDLLINDAARAQAHVSHLGITHLPIGQAHIKPRTRDQMMRLLRPKPIPRGGVGMSDRVVVGGFSVAETIEYDQCGGRFHGHGLGVSNVGDTAQLPRDYSALEPSRVG